MLRLPSSVAGLPARALGLLPVVPIWGWAIGAGALLAVLLGVSGAGAEEAAPMPPQPEGKAPMIEKGSSGPWVVYLQALLGLPQTGDFDDATDAAVRSHQRSKGLVDDGLVGPATWGSLGVTGASSSHPATPPPSSPSSPPSGPAPAPKAPSPPTSGNPFGLGATVSQREPQILDHVLNGNHAHEWAPLEYTTADGHHVAMMVSRRAFALSDGTHRLMVGMTFNGAQALLDLIHGAMLTTRISDEIWRQAPTRIGMPNKSWNTDSPVTGGTTPRMYEQSDDVDKKVKAKGDAGLVANEAKDWVLTRRYWGLSTNGKHPLPAGTDKPAGVSGSKHNAGNFGWYPGASMSDGGEPVTQPVGLAHDREVFEDYSQGVRGVLLGSLVIDGVPWDYAQALADPTVTKYINDEGGPIPGARHPDL